MIIEMKITIEIMKKNPLEEVDAQEAQPNQEERTQSTLDAFKQPRKGSSREGVMTYREGRAVHCCTNCRTPHRRMNKTTGVCKDDLCGVAFGDMEASA
jgi:hypothetical protein|tara:strand:- start:74 stop:367 length:294 start_codon:yes stop_codon:yes gene_type:complete